MSDMCQHGGYEKIKTVCPIFTLCAKSVHVNFFECMIN